MKYFIMQPWFVGTKIPTLLPSFLARHSTVQTIHGNCLITALFFCMRIKERSMDKIANNLETNNKNNKHPVQRRQAERTDRPTDQQTRQELELQFDTMCWMYVGRRAMIGPQWMRSTTHNTNMTTRLLLLLLFLLLLLYVSYSSICHTNLML